MKRRMLLIEFFLIFFQTTIAQQNCNVSPFNGIHWGVVLEHPDAAKIAVEKNIPYSSDKTRTLHFNIYKPLGIKPEEVRPAVAFLNGIGDQPNERNMKDAPIYDSWGRLIAANGYVAITMESEVNNIQESFVALFSYLDKRGSSHHVDTRAIGVHTLSANGREGAAYLMSEKAYAGIKAAVLFYGVVPPGPYRHDLPVLFVVAGFDIRPDNYSNLWTEVLKNKSPWTITIAGDMPHAFDAFSETDVSKRLIMTTISYWINQLGPVRPSSAPPSRERAIIAAGYEDAAKKLRLMREWMTEHPNTLDTYALSAFSSALVDTNEFEEAEKYLKKSIQLDSSNNGNFLNLAVVSYALGKPKDAVAQIALFEKNKTPEGFTYFYIANRMIGINKFREAAENYEKALTFPNPYTFVYYNLGCCYAMLGEKDKAFKNLFKAAELKFGNRAGYESDENLKTLHTDLRWKELTTGLK